jgi:mersacidin/lichenicidin family type 2 lantibiotic
MRCLPAHNHRSCGGTRKVAHAVREETMAYKDKLTKEQMIRAWKDKKFRDALSDEQKLQLLDNPIGAVLTDLRGQPASDEADSPDTCALKTTLCIIISETSAITCPAPSTEISSPGGDIGSFTTQYGIFFCPS